MGIVIPFRARVAPPKGSLPHVAAEQAVFSAIRDGADRPQVRWLEGQKVPRHCGYAQPAPSLLCAF